MTKSTPLLHPIIAAFDFDHTLTDRDSLFPFLFFVFPWWKVIKGLLVLIPTFLAFFFKWQSRQSTKEKILTYFFSGMQEADLKKFAILYADTMLDRFLKPEALRCLNWHLKQGHRCLLISASIETYLSPWAKRHGFEQVLASQLEINSAGTLTGKLKGLNCWGKEKQVRLQAYLGNKKEYFLYMYGDSQGDKQLLELADRAYYQFFPEHSIE